MYGITVHANHLRYCQQPSARGTNGNPPPENLSQSWIILLYYAIMPWTWRKIYTVRCPDGSKKTVYRDVNEAFPLYIHGWQGDLSANASGSAKAVGVEDLKSEIKGAYATKIHGLLFAIDEHTQSLMINFRNVYIAFTTDPCKNGDFLLRQVEKLVAEQQRISRWRIQVRTLIELAKNQPNETMQILTIFKEIAGDIGGAPAIEAAALEIAEARQLAEEWINNYGR